MSIDATFEPDAQLVKGGQPRMRALGHSTVASEPVIALDASACDAILDAASIEVGAAACDACGCYFIATASDSRGCQPPPRALKAETAARADSVCA